MKRVSQSPNDKEQLVSTFSVIAPEAGPINWLPWKRSSSGRTGYTVQQESEPPFLHLPKGPENPEFMAGGL